MHKIIKRVFIFIFLMLAVITQLLSKVIYVYAEDKIVAIVNNEVITQKDLDDFLNFMRMQLSSEYKGKQLETKIQSMKLDLLQRLIEDRLILQEAKRNKVQANKSRVSARIAEMKKRYGSDVEFQNSLRQQGLTQADLEAKISDQFLTYGIIEMRVRSRVIVSPAEVMDYYNKHKQDFISPEEREVEIATIPSEEMAKDILHNLKAFQNLSDLANRFGLTQEQLKISKNGQLNKEAEDAIFKLNLNQISEPIKIQNTYYVFQLKNIVPPKELTLAEARDSVASFLFTNKMQEVLPAWIDELKKRSYIKIFRD